MLTYKSEFVSRAHCPPALDRCAEPRLAANEPRDDTAQRRPQRMVDRQTEDAAREDGHSEHDDERGREAAGSGRAGRERKWRGRKEGVVDDLERG